MVTGPEADADPDAAADKLVLAPAAALVATLALAAGLEPELELELQAATSTPAAASARVPIRGLFALLSLIALLSRFLNLPNLDERAPDSDSAYRPPSRCQTEPWGNS